MSDVPMERAASQGRSDFAEAFAYRLMVLALFMIAALAIAGARIAGRRGSSSFWQEVRQTAHAVAGYAFKY